MLPGQRTDFPLGTPNAHSQHKKTCCGGEESSLNKLLHKAQVTRTQLEIIIATSSSIHLLIQSLSKVRGRGGQSLATRNFLVESSPVGDRTEISNEMDPGVIALVRLKP